MSIDVTAETVIDRAREDVARYAMEPDNDPTWIGGIVEAKRLSEGPIGEGTRVARVAKFLGKRIEYVNEVVEYDAQGLLVMRSVSGPFPMQIRYEFEERAGGTLARIRVQGEGKRFFRMWEPLLRRMVKRNVSKDLKRLKRLMEA